MKKLLIIIIISLNIFGANAQHFGDLNLDEIEQLATTEKWSKEKGNDEISIKYLWLNFGDTLKSRIIHLSFQTHLQRQLVLPLLRHAEQVKNWDENVRVLKNYAHEKNSWISHTIYDIPFPLTQQDVLVKNCIIEKANATELLITPIPHFRPELQDCKRQTDYYARWKLQSTANGTQVTYEALSLSDTNIPRFLKDPIIREKLSKSMLQLKQLCETKATIYSQKTH